MLGLLLDVWPDMWQNVWQPVQTFNDQLPDDLALCLEQFDFPESYESHQDLYSALYTEAFRALREGIREGASSELYTLANTPDLAFQAFKNLKAQDFASEQSLVHFLEEAHAVFMDYDEVLANRYKILLGQFISRFSIRYELSDPFVICPTLPGAYSSLFHQIKQLSNDNLEILPLLDGFLIAYRDLRNGVTEDRIKTCIHKLTMYIEGVASHHCGSLGQTLGDSCKVLKVPHRTIQESLSKLYGFTSDYPGIRHAGNPKSKMRSLAAKDLHAITIILSGYLPYILEIDSESVYLPTVLSGVPRSDNHE